MEYQWKIKSLANKVDANEVASEMDTVKDLYGSLTPENIVNYTENNKTILRELFEWNNKKAAYHYRLQQARTILNNIEVKVVSNGEPKNIPVYETVKENERQTYKSIDAITENEAEQIRKDTLKEISKLKQKLEVYDNFSNVIVMLTKIEKELT